MSDLEDLYGRDNVSRLLVAYEAALRSVAAGGKAVPERSIRLVISDTILGAARRGEFDPERLTREALRAAGVKDAVGGLARPELCR